MGMRKSGLLLASMALAVLLASGVAWAAAGDLDKTFGGGDGRVFDTSHEWLRDVEVLASGKIVALSSEELLRYDEDGSLDTTFGGGDGVVVPSKPLGFFRDLLLQPDGKLVVSGGGSSGALTLRRYNPNGSIDQAFGGGDGTAAVGFGERIYAYANELGLQSKKILAVGNRVDYRNPGTQIEADNTDAFVARFDPNGSLDTTFGGDGRARIDFGGKDNYATDVATQADGKLLVAGHKAEQDAGASYVHDFTLARLHPDGTLDPSFGGGDGKVVTDFGDDDTASALVVHGGGAPVVVGTTEIGSRGTSTYSTAFALAAYTAEGSPDPGFGGGDGKQQTLFSECSGYGSSHAGDAVRQASGKIIAVGGTCVEEGDEVLYFALARFDPDSGELDPTFGGGDGTVETRFVSSYLGGRAYAADIGADGGKLVAGGLAYRYNANGEYPVGKAALARYLLD